MMIPDWKAKGFDLNRKVNHSMNLIIICESIEK